MSKERQPGSHCSKCQGLPGAPCQTLPTQCEMTEVYDLTSSSDTSERLQMTDSVLPLYVV